MMTPDLGGTLTTVGDNPFRFTQDTTPYETLMLNLTKEYVRQVGADRAMVYFVTSLVRDVWPFSQERQRYISFLKTPEGEQAANEAEAFLKEWAATT